MTFYFWGVEKSYVIFGGLKSEIYHLLGQKKSYSYEHHCPKFSSSQMVDTGGIKHQINFLSTERFSSPNMSPYSTWENAVLINT